MKTKTEIFIENAVKIHCDRYDYGQVEYVTNTNKIKIVCNAHGVFEQSPNSHLRGSGCMICSRKASAMKHTLTTEKFIEQCTKHHNYRYDYGMVEYSHNNIPVKIICKEHGVFEQLPITHSRGANCPMCVADVYRVNHTSTTNDFKIKAIDMHGDRFDYSLVEYIHSKSKVKIICKEHGVFEQRPNDHLNGIGCPNCVCKTSKPEIEVFEFIKTLSDNITQSNRKIIKPKELDIYCPDEKIAVEFNGMYWHSSASIETHEEYKNKHLFKTEQCELLGIKLFHIFENEWKIKQEIWKSILTNAFNKSEFKSVTSVKPVSKTVAKKFFINNSLTTTNQSGIGYYSYSKLIAVLSNDVLVYKLYTTSDIQPDVLKINLRFPENLLKYKLIEITEPNPHFHNYKKFVKSENAFMSYANGYSCIWDCGYKIYKRK